MRRPSESRLVNLRRLLGWTPSRIHVASGISASAVNAIEEGRRVPRERTAKALARFYGLTPEKFIDACKQERERRSARVLSSTETKLSTRWNRSRS